MLRESPMFQIHRVVTVGTTVRIKVGHQKGLLCQVAEDLTTDPTDPMYLLGGHRYGLRLPSGNIADYSRSTFST